MRAYSSMVTIPHLLAAGTLGGVPVYRRCLRVGPFSTSISSSRGTVFDEHYHKALPLLCRYRHPGNRNWRSAFLWGLASGAGFGIAEGVMYAGNYYNGVSGP